MATMENRPESARPDGASTQRSGGAAADVADIHRRHLEVAAYYIAERRGFAGDHALDDWLEAERQIDGRAAEAGVKHEASVDPDSLDRDLAALEKADTGRGDPNQQRIEPDAVKQWASTLGVSPEELRMAIREAGSAVEDVKRHLAKSRA